MEICLKVHGVSTPPDEDPVEDISRSDRCFRTGSTQFQRILDLVPHAALPVHLTFDDAGKADVEMALPLVSHAGVRASFFFSTDLIGSPGYADEDDIRHLHAAGVVVGSHGCRHVSWNQMTGDEIVEDTIRSFARLSSILNDRVDAVAAPYGDCDARILKLLRQQKVGRVYTSFPGPTLKSDWLVRRQTISADMPEGELEHMLRSGFGPVAIVRSFVHVYRRVGNAALWRKR